jgi:hypothetical protein
MAKTIRRFLIFDPHPPFMAKLSISRFLIFFLILFSAFSCATRTLPTFPNFRVNCWENNNEEARDLCLQLYNIDPDVAMEVNKLPEFQGKIGDLQIQALGRFLKVLANASYGEKANLTRFLSSGFPKVRKYSAHLQGIFWVLEKEDNENILTYSLETLLNKAWDFSDSRWEDYETVTDRLNTPRLIDYYQRKRFVFVPYPEHPWNPRGLFKTNKGSCIEFTSFALVCLKKAGYKAAVYNPPWKSDEFPGFHQTTLFRGKSGQFYVMDNGRFDPKGLMSFARYYNEGY